ncbi:nicotinamidase [Pendulispora albinea]|uniref:Nicotinamidase n=1 Tax=Pendulispora albinea TaxID=2741071 RepID=A0ABZ2LZQ9_9BACT
MSARPLPLPEFFDPANAARYHYVPDAQRLFTEAARWRKEYGITPSSRDAWNVHLLLIDVQKDFCFPEGSLYVAGRSGRGAIDDNRRLAEFIYRHLNAITHVTATLDTHLAFQIFFPSFWVDEDGAPLAAFREITTDDIDLGRARPNPDVAAWLCNGDRAWLLRQARHYCAELEKAGKYRLYLWPPHCILGSAGHALAGVLDEARMFHAFARSAQSRIEAKGDNVLTENYSVFGAEVLSRHDGPPLAQRNTALLDTLLTADAVLVAGQAASHCVKSSIDDLLDEIVRVDERLAQKVYILVDCMSSVTVPDGRGGFAADFTPDAERALARFREAGMHLVRSTDPMAPWAAGAQRTEASLRG